MSSQPVSQTFDMNLEGRYYLLLASGRKDIEVRVLYPKLQALGPGACIRLCLTKVGRIAAYGSFEQLLDAENPVRIDPDASPLQQLLNLRRIYSLEKEALGVLAIQVSLI